MMVCLLIDVSVICCRSVGRRPATKQTRLWVTDETSRAVVYDVTGVVRANADSVDVPHSGSAEANYFLFVD